MKNTIHTQHDCVVVTITLTSHILRRKVSSKRGEPNQKKKQKKIYSNIQGDKKIYGCDAIGSE